MIVHTPAGIGADIVARLIVDIIEKEKLMPVAVEVVNQPAAAA